MAERYDLPRTGPTQMARVEGGYELKNRQVRVVIDQRTGDVTYWGSADGQRNLLVADARVRLEEARRGDVVTPSRLDAMPTGYVEKRDDQTWQYIGEDPANQLRWRKVFCLEGSSLLVTFIIENAATVPLGSSMSLRVLPQTRGPRINQPDLYEADTDLGRVILRGYRERPYEGPFPRFVNSPAVLISDTFELRPGERFSFTTEWRLESTLTPAPPPQ